MQNLLTSLMDNCSQGVTPQGIEWLLLSYPCDSINENLLSVAPSHVYYATLESYSNRQRKFDFLVARLLLNQLFGAEVVVCNTSTGLPYIEGTPYHISISHTQGAILVARHRFLPIGVDVEKQADRAYKLRAKYLSAAEIAALSVVDPCLHATLLWSAKESLFKAIQEQEVDFCRHLHLQPHLLAQEQWGSFTATESRTAKAKQYCIYYKVLPNLLLTLAIEG